MIDSWLTHRGGFTIPRRRGSGLVKVRSRRAESVPVAASASQPEVPDAGRIGGSASRTPANSNKPTCE